MFQLVSWIKSCDLDFNINVQCPTAKYRSLALPSAGMLPFLQSILCDVGGSGLDDGPFSDMPTFPNATYIQNNYCSACCYSCLFFDRVNGLYTVLDEIGTWNASWTEVCSSIHRLVDQGCLDYDLNPESLSCVNSPGKINNVYNRYVYNRNMWNRVAHVIITQAWHIILCQCLWDREDMNSHFQGHTFLNGFMHFWQMAHHLHDIHT